jgi:Domain of unknown function (DUF1840)
MLVTFRSTATESITMFGDVAVALLKLMGATGRVPGGLGKEDVPAALQRLESEIERLKAGTHAATPARPADNEDWSADDEDKGKDKSREREPPVALTVRAIPLLSLLKRAAAADAEVTWETK